MEKELNIAAILKDKPKNTKLWSCIYGDVYLDGVNDIEGIKLGHHGVKAFLLSSGKAFENGEVCLSPSKKMRDWSKFAWKAGDVLQISDIGFCTFEAWTSDDYTTFKGKYGVGLGKNFHHDYISKEDLATSKWYKVEDKSLIKDYLDTVEKRLGGKLNLETLDITKPNHEFKDGDIVVYEFLDDSSAIVLVKRIGIEGEVYFHAYMLNGNVCIQKTEKGFYGYVDKVKIATDSEKQQLFDALEKEGKAWDAEKKAIVDLPKKCEFEPFQKVLVRCKDYQKWKVDFFSHYDDSCKGFPYVCVSSRKSFCIPYNDLTKHLLGTTDEWKGGEG